MAKFGFTRNKTQWIIFLGLLCTITQLSSLHALDYTVRKGDTLYSLARRFSISVNELMRVNKLDNPNSLSLGMVLHIPDEQNQGAVSQYQRAGTQQGFTTHVVSSGQTLYYIARLYSMPIDELLEVNGLSPNSTINVGQQLIVRNDNSSNVASSQKWPTPGNRELLSNKLEGVRILGKQDSLVYAVRSGTVMWQGPYRNYGVVALIVSEDGYVYLYGGSVHLLVNTGQNVSVGEPIGKIEDQSSQPYVYFSVFRNGEFINIEQAPRG